MPSSTRVKEDRCFRRPRRGCGLRPDAPPTSGRFGVGVPIDVASLLFRPHAQASWRGGTGLGLYHVKELVTALGGVVGHAQNAPMGAIFWADLPYVPLEPQSTPLLETVVIEPTTRVMIATPAHAPAPVDAPAAHSILVVEDDSFIRETTRAIVNAEGVWRVATAVDSEEGLRRLTSSESYTLALIDLQMPIMDGLQCCAELRAWQQQPQAKRTRCIAVSANSTTAALPRVLCSGL